MTTQTKQPAYAALEARIDELTAELDFTRQALQVRPLPAPVVSHLGHDLRTPLNAILGFSQIIASDSLPTSEAQKKKFADHILKAGRHLLMLINQTIDLMKLGSIPATMAPVKLADVFEKCAALVTPLANARAISVSFPADACLNIVSDIERLVPALVILFDNAIKYNRAGGSVTVNCTQQTAASVCIDVTDTGNGIHEADLARLFEPFQRLGQEDGAEDGSGIGLYLCQGLMASLGGRINVSSKIGVGSTFSLILPLDGNTTTLPCTP